ncbi:MAG: ATP-binding protein [Opitutus sp.]|nr:ATP-binding protein [Opitutus sp.]
MSRVRQAVREFPVTVLLGARQVGKSTLAHAAVADRNDVVSYDLERPADARALEQAAATLERHTGLVIVDEIQRQPALFTLLRPLADRKPRRTRFILLGSASPALMKGVSESLAGRASFIEVPGFSLDETGVKGWRNLWLRGGFPLSYLANDEAASRRWREAFVTAFLERDLPQLGISVPAVTLRRFWTMTAHYHGQIWNVSELARSLGSDYKTTSRYLDILAGDFVLRILRPWFENLGRRYGFEFKYSDAPDATKSMHVAMTDLKLEHLWVVYPGTKTYSIADDITAVPITQLPVPP